MKLRILFSLAMLACLHAQAQELLTAEKLWSMGRIGEVAVSPNGTQIAYTLTFYNVADNKGNTDIYITNLKGDKTNRVTTTPESEFNIEWKNDATLCYISPKNGDTQVYQSNINGTETKLLTNIKGGINGFKLDPTGKKILYIADVKLDQSLADKYPDLPKAEAKVFDDLMYRHWNQWHDYAYSHIFYSEINDAAAISAGTDIMPAERWDSPMNPFGGMEQITWSQDGNSIFYTCKKMVGKDYTLSTNSEIYEYNTTSKITRNLTFGNLGYDTNPLASADGKYLANLAMKRNGFEADKNDIVIRDIRSGSAQNLTEGIDLTIADYIWTPDSKKIYFLAVINATEQIFEIEVATKKWKQITEGTHNFISLALCKNGIVAGKQSMQYPTDLFIVAADGIFTRLTNVNADVLRKIQPGKVEKRMVTTSDNKEMLVWVIYPPNFDPTKKYPTLLYCQGGPQSAVSQFYSYRWNFQMMAANGYIVVAPNRRGLPGFGQEWNDQISGDWGGQCMRDYLAAIDDVSAEKYVDNDRLGAVGASFGGYSVYYLAGIHQGRFKAFISHCGMFNTESWYATTEEMFFANWDTGGPSWDAANSLSYNDFSPNKYIKNWDTPIMVIHNDKDFRVPVSEGIQAFNSANLVGVPARFLYFPNEGHWVNKPQNSIVWQREFFEWLDLWLKK